MAVIALKKESWNALAVWRFYLSDNILPKIKAFDTLIDSLLLLEAFQRLEASGVIWNNKSIVLLAETVQLVCLPQKSQKSIV